MRNVRSPLNWIKIIVHRYLRLLPPYLVLVVLLEPLLFYTCEGPLCPVTNQSNCPEYWWRNILNINNLWPLDQMCAGWTWYLANDFQFFLVSPVFLVLLVTIPPLSWVILGSTMVTSWIVTVWMVDHQAETQSGKGNRIGMTATKPNEYSININSFQFLAEKLPTVSLPSLFCYHRVRF